MGPDAVALATATCAAAASATRAAVAALVVMMLPEGAADSVSAAASTIRARRPVGVVSKMDLLLAEALVIRELRRAAAASKMGLLSGRGSRTTAARRRAEVRPSRTGPRRAAASVATMGPDAVVLATATRAAAASATRAAVAALVMRVPEGADLVMLAAAALEMMLLPAAGASTTGLLSGRALVLTTGRRRGAVRLSRTPPLLGEVDSRTGPLLGEAGSRTGARRRRRAGPPLAGTESLTEGVCGGEVAPPRPGRRPRGPSDRAASPSLAAGRTARPTRRTTGAAAAATRRRRRHFHPLISPPYNYLETLSNIGLVASSARLKNQANAAQRPKPPSTAFSTLRSSASPVEASGRRDSHSCGHPRRARPGAEAKTSIASSILGINRAHAYAAGSGKRVLIVASIPAN